MDQDNPSYTSPPDLGWNNDAAWIAYVEDLRPAIESIASKYSTDHGLKEDAVQNAMIELLHQFPEQTRGFEELIRDEITQARWQEILKSYCLNIARNQILSTLSSHTTGDLYVGRTHVTRKITQGTKRKIKSHSPSRYVSLDQLVEDSGLQVSEEGDLSWSNFRELSYGDEDT